MRTGYYDDTRGIMKEVLTKSFWQSVKKTFYMRLWKPSLQRRM
jgi:hypothetical protein